MPDRILAIMRPYADFLLNFLSPFCILRAPFRSHRVKLSPVIKKIIMKNIRSQHNHSYARIQINMQNIALNVIEKLYIHTIHALSLHKIKIASE